MYESNRHKSSSLRNRVVVAGRHDATRRVCMGLSRRSHRYFGVSWSSGPDQFLSVNVSQGTPVRATAHGRIKSTSNSYAWDSHATDLTPWVGVMEDVEMPLWVVSLSTRQTVQVAGETNAPLIWGMSSYYYSA